MTMAMPGRRIDLDLNRSASECSDSVKELLRNAMLQHDATFKHQVRELHRLYWTQKNLMKELCYKDVMNAGIFPFQPTRGRSSVDPWVNETIGFNVEVPNDSIIQNVRFISQEVKNKCNASDNDIDSGIDKRSLRHAINLEEPAELEDNRDAVVSLKSVETPQYGYIGEGCIHSRSKSETTNAARPLDNFGLVSCGMKESSDLLKESTGLPSIDHLMQKQQSSSCRLFDIDLNEALDDEFLHASHDPRLIFPSPSTSSSVTQQMVYEPHVASCSTKGVPRELSNIRSKESSINSALSSKEEDTCALCCPDKIKSKESSWTYDRVEAENRVLGKESNRLDTVSVERISNYRDGKAANRDGEASKSATVLCQLEENTVGVSVDYQDCAMDGKNKRKLMSRQNSSVTSSRSNTETNCLHASLGSSKSSPCQGIMKTREGSRDDTLSSHTTEHDEDQKDVSNKNPKSKRSKSMIVEKEQKDVEDSGTTQEDIAGRDICHVNQAKVDELMIKAAEMIVSMSLQSSACLPAFLTSENAGFMDQETKYDSEYDSDSFEFLTLNLPESKSEDVLTSSSLDKKETYKESCGIKLRRGRRLRDFQKEILPGLVSLSRHEICEDLHNIGHQLNKKCSRGRRRRNFSRRRC